MSRGYEAKSWSCLFFFFSSRRRHTRFDCDWSSDVCSSDLGYGEPAAALKEYEVSMKNAPNRLRGYYGAAKAAQDSGQAKKAGAYYKQLARLTRDADGDRPEIVELKQHLASAK